jgi:hypothetical protein
MKTYLANTEYAVKKIFEAIKHEEDEFINLITKREAALKEPKFLKNIGWERGLHKDFDETRVMILFHRAVEARKRLPKRLKEIDKKIEDITDNIKLHSESSKVLCGSLLQFAKQGISIIHKKLSACPSGREIGQETLKNIIWQGRNHALHYEESPNHKQQVRRCFKNLEDFGLRFCLDNQPNENLSKEIIHLLGWSGYSTFKEDMLLLSLNN